MTQEKEKFDATKYKNDFQKEKYDRIIVNVPKGQKQIIDERAKKQGYKSLNSFVVEAINEKLDKAWNNGFIFLLFKSCTRLTKNIYYSCTRLLYTSCTS